MIPSLLQKAPRDLAIRLRARSVEQRSYEVKQPAGPRPVFHQALTLCGFVKKNKKSRLPIVNKMIPSLLQKAPKDLATRLRARSVEQLSYEVNHLAGPRPVFHKALTPRAFVKQNKNPAEGRNAPLESSHLLKTSRHPLIPTRT
jgi:hypothetical protein